MNFLGPRGETLTTLVPIDPRCSHTSFSRSIADEVAPLMPHDSIMKIRTGDSNMRVSERSLNGGRRSVFCVAFYLKSVELKMLVF